VAGGADEHVGAEVPGTAAEALGDGAPRDVELRAEFRPRDAPRFVVLAVMERADMRLALDVSDLAVLVLAKRLQFGAATCSDGSELPFGLTSQDTYPKRAFGTTVCNRRLEQTVDAAICNSHLSQLFATVV